ncbi:MAG: hypothetical protein GC165_02915 [Armatimonadetes bacterium]|nr:hypothetical protein [Armatimonadota bacterium]
MIASILFGACLITRQEPKVSLDLRGVRLENAAPILARTFGWDSLEIGPTLINEVILVRAKDIEPSVLRDKLAFALNGTWEHRKEGWRLTQSDDQKDAEKKYDAEQHFKFYKELTEKAQKKLQEMKPFDEQNCKALVQRLEALSKTRVDRFSNSFWRQIQAIDSQSPASRFGYRAAMRLKPQTWMQLTPENPRIVFCNHPNAMQQAFPFQVDDLLSQVAQDQNQWSIYAAGQPLPGPRAGNSEEDGYYSLGELNQKRDPYKTTDFATVTMTLQYGQESIEFAGYDRDGHRSFQSSVSFYDYGDDNYNYQDELDKQRKMAVKLTGDADEYVNLISPMSMKDRQKAKQHDISPSLLEKILHPEKVDPLSISAPDVYLSSIDTPNVIMVLNDYQRGARFAEFKDPRYARYGMLGAITDENGWFIYRQPDPVANRKSMPDRKRLGPILRYIYKNQRPLNLEEQADLAISLPWEQDYAYAYQRYLDLLSNKEVENYGNRTGLRIYGSMSDVQRKQAAGQGLRVSQMSDSTKLELYRALFYSQRYETQLNFDYEAVNKMTDKERNEFYKMQELIWGGIYEEKTFAIPQGLLNNFVLTIKDNSTDKLYAGRPPAQDDRYYYGEGRSMGANELGQYLFKIKFPQRYRWEVDNYNKIDEKNIRLISQRNLTIKLAISPLLNCQWTLTQSLFTDPKVYTADTLPQNILDEIKKGYAEAEKYDKQYGDQIGNYPRPTHANPPPSR